MAMDFPFILNSTKTRLSIACSYYGTGLVIHPHLNEILAFRCLCRLQCHGEKGNGACSFSPSSFFMSNKRLSCPRTRPSQAVFHYRRPLPLALFEAGAVFPLEIHYSLFGRLGGENVLASRLYVRIFFGRKQKKCGTTYSMHNRHSSPGFSTIDLMAAPSSRSGLGSRAASPIQGLFLGCTCLRVLAPTGRIGSEYPVVWLIEYRRSLPRRRAGLAALRAF